MTVHPMTAPIHPTPMQYRAAYLRNGDYVPMPAPVESHSDLPGAVLVAALFVAYVAIGGVAGVLLISMLVRGAV